MSKHLRRKKPKKKYLRIGDLVYYYTIFDKWIAYEIKNIINNPIVMSIRLDVKQIETKDICLDIHSGFFYLKPNLFTRITNDYFNPKLLKE
jgi:hypothetical protein